MRGNSTLGLLFLAVALPLVLSLHLYLYRRLVRDLTARPRLRRAGALAVGALAVLILAANQHAYLEEVSGFLESLRG